MSLWSWTGVPVVTCGRGGRGGPQWMNVGGVAVPSASRVSVRMPSDSWGDGVRLPELLDSSAMGVESIELCAALGG